MSQLALYRAYRPKNFDEIYGQDHLTEILKNAVREGTFSHAYLFCGPRGTGKTSAARILAKAVNCDDTKEGNPDDTCKNCLSINEGKSLDIIEIDAASHTQVDNIREVIIERAHFAPTSLKYKIYIIDEAHMLSKSSFNALLKTLEEPPEHAVFVLATTEINKIPATIVSRCQRFDFKRISNVEIEKRLRFIADNEKIKINDEAIRLIAKASEGGFRDAISYLDQISSLGKEAITETEVSDLIGMSDSQAIEDYILAIVEKETTKALEIIRLSVEDGLEPSILQKGVVEFLRKLLLSSVSGVSEVDFSLESQKSAEKNLAKLNNEKIIYFIDTLVETEQKYRFASLPQLGLEVATIKICLDNSKVKKPDSAEASTGRQNSKEEKREIAEDQPTALYGTGQPKVGKPDKSAQNTKAGKIAKKPSSALWQQLLLEVKSKNNSIHAFLKVSEPEFDEKTVCLYFPYKFHKERIEESKNRQVVEESFTRIYGQDYKIKCYIRSNNGHQIAQPIKDDLLDDALEIFGGEVIE